MAKYDARILKRLLNFLNTGSLTSMVVMSRIQRVLATNQRNGRQLTIFKPLLPWTSLCKRPDGTFASLEGRYFARFVRAFVDVGDIMCHRALARRLLTGDPPQPVLFQPTPNMPIVYTVVVREGETFDPETQTVRRRIYIKYGRSRNVPTRVQQHRVTYGMVVFLSMLPVPADMLMQCEGFLRDEFSVVEQRIPIILEHISVYYDLQEEIR